MSSHYYEYLRTMNRSSNFRDINGMTPRYYTTDTYLGISCHDGDDENRELENNNSTIS